MEFSITEYIRTKDFGLVMAIMQYKYNTFRYYIGTGKILLSLKHVIINKKDDKYYHTWGDNSKIDISPEEFINTLKTMHKNDYNLVFDRTGMIKTLLELH